MAAGVELNLHVVVSKRAEKNKNKFNVCVCVCMCVCILCTVSVGIHCGDPGNASRADKSGGYFYGDWVTYECHTGYEMTSGDPVLYCRVTGIWSGIRPTCSSTLF